MKPKVFISERIASRGIEMLEDDCLVTAPWREQLDLDGGQLRELLYESDATIVRLFRITAEDIERCTRLKVISRHGVGTDAVDCRAAASRCIPVLITPDANMGAVAEHTVTMMMALARHVGPAWKAVVEGRFADRSKFEGVELAGRTLGVVGFGRIGARVAHIAAQGLGMQVLASDPALDADADIAPVTRAGSLEELLGAVDFLSLHLPLNAHTRGMINDKTLALMKPGCRIVNTSRGGVIDESALVRALESGAVAGAALDVFESEPLAADHPLCQAPNTLLTPHIGAQTLEALDNMSHDAAQGVLDVLQGRAPKHVVNL